MEEVFNFIIRKKSSLVKAAGCSTKDPVTLSTIFFTMGLFIQGKRLSANFIKASIITIYNSLVQRNPESSGRRSRLIDWAESYTFADIENWKLLKN